MNHNITIPQNVVEQIEARVLAMHYQVLADVTKPDGPMTKEMVHKFSTEAAQRFRDKNKD